MSEYQWRYRCTCGIRDLSLDDGLMDTDRIKSRPICLSLRSSGPAETQTQKVSSSSHASLGLGPTERIFFSTAATRLGQSCPPSSVPVPFDALSSFDALHYLRLGNSTQSHACPPHHLVPPLSLSVPTGVLADLPVVETITFLAIWTGMLWVCRVAFKTRLPSNCKYEKEDAGNAKEGKSNQESREKTRKKQ